MEIQDCNITEQNGAMQVKWWIYIIEYFRDPFFGDKVLIKSSGLY